MDIVSNFAAAAVSALEELQTTLGTSISTVAPTLLGISVAILGVFVLYKFIRRMIGR